jgi:phosphohistidine phosphatase
VRRDGAGVDLTARTEWVEDLYHSALDTLLDVLTAAAPCPDVMLLGHNPGLEELLNYLAGGGVDGFDKTFPTGAVYVLECPRGLAELDENSARISCHQRPKLLER